MADTGETTGLPGTLAARAASKSVKLQRPARATVCSHSGKGHGRQRLSIERITNSSSEGVR
jgi:hypothetical protein